MMICFRLMRIWNCHKKKKQAEQKKDACYKLRAQGLLRQGQKFFCYSKQNTGSCVAASMLPANEKESLSSFGGRNVLLYSLYV
mmetsp:Transcript_11669/g.17128  ORF Transcript_11669/g.17128 Transcript_11669/m.17128 type:complete len:83 (-) Transcript_11669:17-265(-)